MTTDTLGGVWTYSLTLARELLARRHDVVLVSCGRPLSAAQHDEIRALAGLRHVETTLRCEWMPDPWDDVAELGRLLGEIESDFEPDVVHLNDYSNASLPWRAPVVVVAHSCVLSWMEAVRGRPAGSEWSAYRERVGAGLAAADLVVAPTHWMLDRLHALYGTVGRCTVIANGIAEVDRPRAGSKGRWVLSAGRLWDEAKNVSMLAEVALSLAWPVVVAGERRMPHAPAGGEVYAPGLHLLGALSRERLRGCYASTPIYALPALYEPFGLTVLEAASAGCALVVSDLASLRETWRSAAEYVPPGDVRAWTRALAALIADGERRGRLAAAAVARARELTSARMAERYLEAYRSLPPVRLPAASIPAAARSGRPERRRTPCAS